MNRKAYMKRERSRKGDSTEETLRGQNRELQKKIRQLTQQIGQLEKELMRLSGKTGKTPKPAPAITNTKTCTECGKGQLQTTTYPIRGGSSLTVITCTVCEYSEKYK
jgi:hypothetical protein